MNEDAVNGEILHLVAKGTDGKNVYIPTVLVIARISEEDSDGSDGLHPFADVGTHIVISFCCRDLKCLIVALGGASWEIGSRLVSNGKYRPFAISLPSG